MTGPVGVFVGLTTLDVVHSVDTAPEPNEKITARAQFVAAGGPATNAAVTFAALGGEAVLVTALGQGAAASIVRADLEACRVRIVDVAADQVDRVPVSSITVVASTGDRSIVSVDATLNTVGAPAGLADVLAGADIVLVDGHHPALAEQAAREAAAARVPLVLDAGRWRPVMDALIPHVAAVICSADFRAPGAADAESSARVLRGRGVPTVVVTRGGDPVLWWQDGASGAVAPPEIQVVDTAGAGDAFHGAYCYYAGCGDVADTVLAACRVAAVKCRYPGTRTWLGRLQTTV